MYFLIFHSIYITKGNNVVAQENFNCKFISRQIFTSGVIPKQILPKKHKI